MVEEWVLKGVPAEPPPAPQFWGRSVFSNIFHIDISISPFVKINEEGQKNSPES
jgi:hypothetical protein